MTAVYEWIRNLTAFSVFICNGKSAAGAEVRKVYPAICGVWCCDPLLAVEPFTSGFNLDEVVGPQL